MHSQIFQLSCEPISKEKYIEEDFFYDHWFTYSVADYVSDTCRRADVKKITENIPGIEGGVDENGEFFIIRDKEKYFEEAFKNFLKILDALKEAALEDFAEDNSVEIRMRALNEEYCCKTGSYTILHEKVVPFDEFVRYGVLDLKYYIGAVLDYHR